MMVAKQPIDIAGLSRLLSVREARSDDEPDVLVLASPWQRLPEQSGWRLGLALMASLFGLMLLAFTVQGTLTGQVVWFWLDMGLGAFAVLLGWWIRPWFWQTEFALGSATMSLRRLGWYVPPSRALVLADIEALCFSQHDGQLQQLGLQHARGFLPIPISGVRELDRLYCNLLRHMLQKHCATIGFREIPPTAVAIQE